MFRRRPRRRLPMKRRGPARFWRGQTRRLPPIPALRDALARANRLMADGRYAEAAAVFQRFSREAQRRGLIVRSGDLALQAARARFRSGDVETALEWAHEGIRLLIQGGRPGRAERMLSRTTAALRENGYEAEADQLEQEFRQALERAEVSDRAAQQAAPAPERRGTLPATCSGCASPLIPDEVEWHSADAAECLYCGSIIKAT
jgi:hypothetical protein